MTQESKKWLIKKTNGKIQGPYKTKDVVTLLQMEKVTEEDFIASYPNNDWIPISNSPEFYDILLSIISDEVPGEEPGVDSLPQDISEVISSPLENTNEPRPVKQSIKDKTKVEQQINNPKVESRKRKEKSTSKSSSQSRFRGESTYNSKVYEEQFGIDYRNKTSKSNEKVLHKDKESSVIELSSIDKVELKEKIKSISLSGLVLILSAILLGVFLFFPGEQPSSRVKILAPAQKISLTQEQLLSLFKLGSQFYYMDTYNNYVNAQEKLVQVLEAFPSHLPALSLLCMTHLELWPYSYKSYDDSRAIEKVVQMASKQDPSGAKGNPCKVVQALIKGENEEAESITDGVLSSINEDESPPTYFYFLKSLHLQRRGSYSSALGYISSVQEINPQWLKAYVTEAQLHSYMKDYAAATRRYKQILDANPKHKVAWIFWGLIEHQQFFRYANAKSMLKRALKINDRAPQKLISDAYTTLAEIAIYENDNKSALEYAKQAYINYSSNKVAEAIIRKLDAGNLPTSEVKGSQLLDEGEVFEKEGDCNAAQALYKAAFQKNPKYGLAALKAAKCLWKLSLSTEAIEWLNKAIKADPKLIDAYISLADYYSQRFDFEAAGGILVKANKISANNFEVFRSFALIEYRRKNYLGAINYGKKALSMFESDVDTLILLGKSQLESGNINEAYNLANRAIELNPNNREANILYARSMSAARGRSSGIRYMQNIVDKYPLIKEYRLSLGKMYFEDESYNDARAVFEQIINLDPNYKEAKIELGKSYRQLSIFDEAFDQFLQAAVMDPADAVPLYEAGLLHMQIKQYQKAIVQFERVLRINKIYPLTHYYIGKAYLSLGDSAKAIEYAQKERKINSRLADSYILAAEAYQKNGQYSLCAKEYHEAIKLRSQGAVIYVMMATCYRKAGNLDIAESMLNQAEQIENGLPDIYREQGQIYEMKGFYDRAIQAYDKYLALNPNAPDAGQIRQKLQSMSVN